MLYHNLLVTGLSWLYVCMPVIKQIMCKLLVTHIIQKINAWIKQRKWKNFPSTGVIRNFSQNNSEIYLGSNQTYMAMFFCNWPLTIFARKLLAFNYFCKKASLWLFEKVLNMPLKIFQYNDFSSVCNTKLIVKHRNFTWNSSVKILDTGPYQNENIKCDPT